MGKWKILDGKNVVSSTEVLGDGNRLKKGKTVLAGFFWKGGKCIDSA